MPILQREPSVYPEALLDAMAEGLSERKWMVLYTKARQEKSLAREMFNAAVPFYLPLVKKTSVIRHRRISSHIPLFGGYLFLYGTEAERIRTLITNRVVRVLNVEDPVGLLRDLRQLRQLIASQAPLTVEARLLPGDRVRVRKGPFAGIEGTVLNRRGQSRLLVSIDFLQRGASVEIEDFLLEPLG